MGAASAPAKRAFGRLEDPGAERIGQGPAALRFDQLVERFGDRLALGPRAGQAHGLSKGVLVKRHGKTDNGAAHAHQYKLTRDNHSGCGAASDTIWCE